MGGGEAGAGKCERCGEVGAVHQLSWVYLCAHCRQAYRLEAQRQKQRVAEKTGGQTERKPR